VAGGEPGRAAPTDWFDRAGIVFNTSKGTTRLDRFRAAARARLGIDGSRLVVYPSASSADGEVQARRAADDGCDLVIAAGGDGTVFHVLRGIVGRGVTLGFLPLGTSNDYAGALGVAGPDGALAALAGGVNRAVDLVECDYLDQAGKPRRDVFCSSAGMGFSGAVARADRLGRLLPLLKRRLGRTAFVLASAAGALAYPGTPARLSLDGAGVTRSVALLEVSKMPRIAGQALTPLSCPADGRLDMAVFDGPLPRRVQLLLSVLGPGWHVGWPDFGYLRGLREIGVESDRPLPLQLHGEWVGSGPAEFRVRPGALRVLAPTG
jgi:diacylglycerol kinase (ATP)